MKRIERVMPLFGACAFAAAMWVLHRELAQLHVRHVVEQLRQMPPRAVWLAGALTGCGYARGVLLPAGVRHLVSSGAEADVVRGVPGSRSAHSGPRRRRGGAAAPLYRMVTSRQS